MFGLALLLHVVEWKEKVQHEFTADVFAECQGGCVLKMACNPIQHPPQFLLDGIPSLVCVVFISDNMLKHISSPRWATSSAGSIQHEVLWCCWAMSPWSKENFQRGRLLWWTNNNNKFYQPGRTGPACLLLKLRLCVSISYQIINVWTWKRLCTWMNQGI